jgi:hypothetical protein
MENLKKKMNQNMDADRLNVGVFRFVMNWAWFVTKWEEVMYYFLQNKKERRIRRNGGGERGSYHVIT